MRSFIILLNFYLTNNYIVDHTGSILNTCINHLRKQENMMLLCTNNSPAKWKVPNRNRAKGLPLLCHEEGTLCPPIPTPGEVLHHPSIPPPHLMKRNPRVPGIQKQRNGKTMQ
jgi:hypothetical protein